MIKRYLTRRVFMSMGLGTASALILAACAPKPEPTMAPVAEPTAVPTAVPPTQRPPIAAPPTTVPTEPRQVTEAAPTDSPPIAAPTSAPTEVPPTAAPDPYAEVPNGGGALLTVDGATVAVYRDDAGEVVVLSPKCPHAGCDVEWNDADKQWVCPCHRSVFEADGTLIKGPARKGLESAG